LFIELQKVIWEKKYLDLAAMKQTIIQRGQGKKPCVAKKRISISSLMKTLTGLSA